MKEQLKSEELFLKYQKDKASAQRLLNYYLGTAYGKAGLRWDEDNSAEVEEFVESVIDAAVSFVLAKMAGHEATNDLPA